MSRVGKKPIAIPQGVKINIKDGLVNVEGPKGKISFLIKGKITVAQQDGQLLVSRKGDAKPERAMHGTVRAILNNMVLGVTKGFSKELDIQGVGYKAQAQGKELVLTLGFSHPVNFNIPEGITIETPKPTQVIIKGIDKQKVGQVASFLRSLKKPEPYKGKGIRYLGEYVRKKAGKTVGK